MARLLAVLLVVLMSFVGQATARGFNGGPNMSFAPHSGFGVGRPGLFAKPSSVHPGSFERPDSFHHGFAHNRFFPRSFNRFQQGFPVWWSGLGSDGWDWPVGDSSDYGHGSAPVEQDQAPNPEVVVIHTDGEGRMTLSQAAPDYGYAGCHAIANGYHCDTTTELHSALRAKN